VSDTTWLVETPTRLVRKVAQIVSFVQLFVDILLTNINKRR